MVLETCDPIPTEWAPEISQLTKIDAVSAVEFSLATKVHRSSTGYSVGTAPLLRRFLQPMLQPRSCSNLKQRIVKCSEHTKLISLVGGFQSRAAPQGHPRTKSIQAWRWVGLAGKGYRMELGADREWQTGTTHCGVLGTAGSALLFQ
ncbi:hypothetical protein HPB49_003631 [Dermacentor silvarum]|uniref:Uncharacterized protein n=1 Tax=Dermacentor silvarum TaxID=543639 RepID=A0ACB8CPC9_DERSI|nr:hypothetical protein HPB49_003631 [Dermacentor silvarum]